MKLPYSLERDSALVNAPMKFVLYNCPDFISAGLQLDEKAVGKWWVICEFALRLTKGFFRIKYVSQAEVAELADALGSGLSGRKVVRVQVPPSASKEIRWKASFFVFQIESRWYNYVYSVYSLHLMDTKSKNQPSCLFMPLNRNFYGHRKHSTSRH